MCLEGSGPKNLFPEFSDLLSVHGSGLQEEVRKTKTLNPVS